MDAVYDGSYDRWGASVAAERAVGGAGLQSNSVALPEQHEDQLDLGYKMISTAFKNKVHGLETELQSLRANCDDSKKQAANLQRKNAQLDQELTESHQRSTKMAEDNKELYKTVQQLRRQLQGLEGLKQKVMMSISSHEQEHVSVHHDAPEESFRSMGNRTVPSPSAPLPPHSQPLVSPAYGRPATASTPVDSLGRADAGAQAASFSGGAASGAVDGKQFFRQARNSLSYEAFNEFLANIKRLNTQQQSREETLEAARRIFGQEHEHLYREFENLLANVVAM